MQFGPIAESGHVSTISYMEWILCDRNDWNYELENNLKMKMEHSNLVRSDGKWVCERVFEKDECNYLGVVEIGGRTECRSLDGPLEIPPPRDGRPLPRPLDDGLLYFGLCTVWSELLSLL